MRPLLFLDFDGVLHPVGGDVAPLEYAPVLVQLLAPHPNVHIVLSTSWVGTFGFDNTRAMLPLELQHRVVGATYRSPLERYLHPNFFTSYIRYQQIAHYVHEQGIVHWLALDDDDEGWPPEMRHHLVCPPKHVGLASLDTQAELADKLRSLTP